MAINDVLTTLTARRDRFRELLAVKSVEVAEDASILQCLEALATYFGVVVGDPEDLYPANRLACNFITLQVPEIKHGSINSFWHVSSEPRLTPVLYYNGEYKRDSNYYVAHDSGSRIRVEVGSYIGAIQVDWVGNSGVNSTSYSSTIQFDGLHTPQYYKRPAHNGVLKLFVDGNEVPLEVYHNGRWMTAPAEGLSAEYTGDYIRLIPDDLATHTAYWTAGDGLDSDEFTYMT